MAFLCSSKFTAHRLYPTHDITPKVPAMAVSTAISSLSISFQFFIFVIYNLTIYNLLFIYNLVILQFTFIAEFSFCHTASGFHSG